MDEKPIEVLIMPIGSSYVNHITIGNFPEPKLDLMFYKRHTKHIIKRPIIKKTLPKGE